MGYDGFFLDRIDYQDRAKWWEEKTMEMVWRGSTSLKQSSDIFTSVLYMNYAPPLGFCFDLDCKDASIQVYTINENLNWLQVIGMLIFLNVG